jgi:hypothetical protein
MSGYAAEISKALLVPESQPSQRKALSLPKFVPYAIV